MMKLNRKWKYQMSTIVCEVCDLFMGYHKRTNRFYCSCGAMVSLASPHCYNFKGPHARLYRSSMEAPRNHAKDS
jgi:hypothetical protein